MSSSFNFLSRFNSGHRQDYIDFTKTELGGERSGLISGIFSKKTLLFLMVEEWFALYCLVALIRSLFGLKTVGLLFRAQDCVSSLKFLHRIKFLILKGFKKFKNIRTVSIVPFSIYPGISDICDDWLYDFQFWDIRFFEKKLDMVVVQDHIKVIKQHAKGRQVVCAVGRQDKSKGFDSFSSLYINNKCIQDNFCFVSGGKISGISDSKINHFLTAGALVINEKISNEMIAALYKSADIIWACYSSNYDQSSGVLGRALQYSLPVIVRKGSIAESISIELDYKHADSGIFHHILDKASIYETKNPMSLDLINQKTKFFDIIK
jgi:hypothetical protein